MAVGGGFMMAVLFAAGLYTIWVWFNSWYVPHRFHPGYRNTSGLDRVEG
jgi:hypothetical protein